MKGLELSEKYYYEYGEKMLKEQFSDIQKYLAVGLVGSGSECLGFDDEISKDHDFEPAFCIFLPDENIIDTKTEFALERAYSKLPNEFMGYKRNKLSAVGGNRHGVIRISDFFCQKTGDKNADIKNEGWFYISEQHLLEATNGKLFFDNFGKMTELRSKIAYLPEDIRLKKLAGNLLIMAQSGQYNYGRCAKRGDGAAAQLAVFEFVNAAIKVIFLLNKKYLPYYKWSFKALKNLKVSENLIEQLEHLISSKNTDSQIVEKLEIIEKVSAFIIENLVLENLSRINSRDLESHAYAVNNNIKDVNIRNLNILCTV